MRNITDENSTSDQENAQSKVAYLHKCLYVYSYPMTLVSGRRNFTEIHLDERVVLNSPYSRNPGGLHQVVS